MERKKKKTTSKTSKKKERKNENAERTAKNTKFILDHMLAVRFRI